VNLKSKLPPRLRQFVEIDGKLPKLLLLPFALVTIGFFILIKPVVTIQVFKVWERFGHLVANTDVRRLKTLNHNQSHKKKLITIYYNPEKRPSNTYMNSLWQQNLPLVRGHWGWLLNDISSHFKFMNASNLSTDIDFEGLYKKSYPLPKFSDEDNLTGQNFINKFCPSGKFVCLIVRDAAYLSSRSGKDWSYHNFRDSKIDSFKSAAEKLAEMGYTVFRMGAVVEKPLASSHPNVIDYATNGMRTEFLDIYLGAHCTFCVSNSNGFDAVPRIFKRPLLICDEAIYFESSHLALHTVHYPKIIREQSNESQLSLRETINRGIANSHQSANFEDAGVEIRDLSSEELVEAVTEMAQRVEGTFVETPEQKEMQAKLKHILSTHPKLQPTPNYYPIRAEFASCFLSRYPNFLDGLD
jgi:putative glycosyltransferase (TIGR04372 family)